MLNLQLDPTVRDLAIALGIARSHNGGTVLDDEFFSDPWSRVSGIFSNSPQRAALVSAMGQLMAQSQLALAPAPGAGQIRQAYPLLDPAAVGQISLIVERDGPAESAAMRLGIGGEVQVAGAGPAARVELMLLAAEGETIWPVVASPNFPLTIEVSAPVSASGARIAAGLLIVAPPHLDESRLSVRLEGIDTGAAPLELDLSGGAPPVARIVVLLLDLLLAQLEPTAPGPLRRLSGALPRLLGLGVDWPPFPFADIARDPLALRSWLAQLVVTRTAQDKSALADWLDALGSLFDASPLPAVVPTGTEDDPILLSLLPELPDVPMLLLSAGVRTDTLGGQTTLVVGLRVEVKAGSIDAALRADAALFAIPLSGSGTTAVLERLDVRLDAPASGAELLPASATGGALGIGWLRAGLRYRAAASGASPSVEPLLELGGITLALGAQTRTIDRLDLSRLDALSGTADTLVTGALESALPSGAAGVIDALRRLAGLGTNPGMNWTLFASAPGQAFVEYYRALLLSNQGWTTILHALGTLLGSAATDVHGLGTPNAPWTLKLDHIAVQDSPVGLQIAVWNAGDATVPRLVVSLRAGAQADAWATHVGVQLLDVELPARGGGAARFMSGVRAHAAFTPPAQPTPLGGLTVHAGAVALDAAWAPGQPVEFQAQIADIGLDDGVDSITLGTLRLPTTTAPDPTLPDLGLGLDPDALARAVPLLLQHSAESLAGPLERDLMALLGVGNGTAGQGAAPLPPLAPEGNLADFLRAPAAGLEAWLRQLTASDAQALDDDGQPHFSAWLGRVQAFIANPASDPSGPLPARAAGGGTPDDPWLLPVHADGALAIAVWAEPGGPPPAWGETALARLRDGGLPLDSAGQASTSLVQTVDALRGHAPWLGDALRGRDPVQAASLLEGLATLLDANVGGDGIVSPTQSTPTATGWDVADAVDAAHDRLPRHPDCVALVRERVETLIAGRASVDWAVLLVAPRLAGDGCWDALLDGVPAADRATISLRSAAAAPTVADLSSVTPASWYEVDLADDGDLSRAESALALGRVVAAVRRVKPGARVVLVAHSYLGVVAEAVAADRPGDLLGVIALAAPLGDAAPAVWDATDFAKAVRLAVSLVPGGMAIASAPLEDTLKLFSRLLDLEGAAATRVLQAAVWQRPASAPSALTVPALAVPAVLKDSFLDSLARAIAEDVAAQTNPAALQRLCWGVRTRLALPAPASGGVTVDAQVALKLGCFDLTSGLDAGVPGWIEFRATLARPDGWLAGTDRATSTRVRWAEFLGVLVPESDTPQVGVSVCLHDVSLRGQAAAQVDLDDPRTPELLDLVLRTLETAAPAGGHVATFLDVLADLGLSRRKTSTVPAAFLADAMQALRSDAAAWLGARLPALLERPNGLLGFERVAAALPDGGPWRLALGTVPFECVIETEPWRITVATTGNGLTLGDDGRLNFIGSVAIDGTEPETSGRLQLTGLTVEKAAPDATVVLSGPWLAEPVSIYPGDAEELGDAFAPLVPRLLVNTTLGRLAEQVFGGALTMGSLDGLLRDPGGWLKGLVLDPATNRPRATVIDNVLRTVASLAGLGSSAAYGLILPGGIGVSAQQTGSGATTALRLAVGTDTPQPLWTVGNTSATLALQLHLSLDQTFSPTPAGEVVLSLPLPDSSWGAASLHLGAHASGVALLVTTTSGLNLRFLPEFGGIETLISAAGQQLLPELLDRLVAALDEQQPRPEVLDDVLDVVAALGIHDPQAAIDHGFRNKAAELGQLVEHIRTGQLASEATHVSDAVATLLRRLFGATLPISSATAPGHMGLALSGIAGGTLRIEADLSATPVGLSLSFADLALGSVTAGFAAGFQGSTVTADLDVALQIDTGVGLVLAPRLRTGLSVLGGPRVSVAFLPLGTDDLEIVLAPQPVLPTVPELLLVVENWLLPLAGTLLLRAAAPVLDTKLWNGSSKDIADVLVSAQLATRDANQALSFRMPLPKPLAILTGVLDAFRGSEIALPGSFALHFPDDAPRYGLLLRGAPRFDVGDYALTLHLGLPPRLDSVWGEAGLGIGMLVLDLSDPAKPVIAPVLRLGGLGAKFGRKDATKPLVDASGFRLGAAGAYVMADVTLSGPGAPSLAGKIYGAIEVDGLGLLIAPGSNGKNPVAASLVQPSGGGDQAPANPPFDMLVASTPTGFAVKFAGKPRLRIQVRRTFGPLHIEEIDILYREALPGPGEIGLSLDASLALAGLKVEADDLTLYVPLDAPGRLSQWKLDLSGLSVSMSTASVSISGGLLRTEAAGTIEYRGSLAIEVAGRGLSALGAYARPTDSQGGYTSLFVFLAISAPLGGPPYLFITGVAGGVGLNRRLLTPRDPAAVPSFPLVQAMDGPAATDPMQQLQRIGKDIPPSRGAFWLAAGVRFSTFELLRTTALLTVSLDRGVEVTLMGLMRLNLPPAEDATIISLELALAAKYSTVDQVLSVQAALTSNSWLLSRDCRLTGGFAFVVWFSRPEVLLTVGGYSSKFQVPSHYPNVPRVGFHWNVAKGIVIKGEQFFALTHSAAMVGGALEASYNVAPIHVWFSAGLDVIVWWEPFHYAVSAHIEIGAEVKIEGEILGIKVTLPSLRITVGAWLELEGPPLRGEVLVDLGIAKFPIPFGEKHDQAFLKWDEARDKYLGPGSAATIAAGAVAAQGQPDGSVDAPWFVSPQFALRVESKMPASAWRLGGRSGAPSFAPATVDVVPCGSELPGPVSGVLEVVIERRTGPAAWEPLKAAELAALEAVESVGKFPGAIWDGGAATTDANGQPTVDTSRSMVAALGTLELRSATHVRETTGQMGDVAVAELLEEETPHPLPFGPAAPPPPVPARRRAPRSPHVPAPLPEQAAAPAPRLCATLAAPQERVSRAPQGAPAARARGRAATGGTPLAAGGAQVWEVSVDQPHRVKAAGATCRVVALSGAGAVLCDIQPGSRGSRLPEGVRTVVLADAPGGESCGWELATPLVRAGAGAFVAPGATLLLPRPWSPRALPGRQPQAWVQAAEITAEVDGITTRFPVADGSTPTVVVVRVDRRMTRAYLRHISIEARGATLGERTVVRRGSRVDITLPVVQLDRQATGLSITVRCGDGWRLAGVLGLRGAARRAAARQSAAPHQRLVTVPAPSGKAARVSLEPLPARRKR
jgi:hypothetical protein